jgi:hypothetical protein
MGLWVKAKTSQHILVIENWVQRIFAIEAKAGQVEANLMGRITALRQVNRSYSTIQLRPLPK